MVCFLTFFCFGISGIPVLFSDVLLGFWLGNVFLTYKFLQMSVVQQSKSFTKSYSGVFNRSIILTGSEHVLMQR